MLSLVRLLAAADAKQDDESLLRKLNAASLLILDDLGAERGTDFKLEQVFNIIETRSNSQKPLIVTTNYSENDMRGENDVRYKRIWERVRAMCYPVRMESVSWRKDITAEALERFRKLTTRNISRIISKVRRYKHGN